MCNGGRACTCEPPVANIYNRVRDAAEAGAIRSPVRYGLTRPTGNSGEFLPLEDWLQSLDPTSLSATVTANTTAITAITTAWTSYTPTVVASSGSSTITGIAGGYKQIGKTVHFRIAFNMSATGTGSGNITASLPVAGVTVNSACSVVNGSAMGGAIIVGGSGLNQVWIYSAAGGFPATGSFIVAGTYEAL